MVDAVPDGESGSIRLADQAPGIDAEVYTDPFQFLVIAFKCEGRGPYRRSVQSL